MKYKFANSILFRCNEETKFYTQKIPCQIWYFASLYKLRKFGQLLWMKSFILMKIVQHYQLNYFTDFGMVYNDLYQEFWIKSENFTWINDGMSVFSTFYQNIE